MIYFERNKTTVKWIFSKEANFNVSIIALFRMNQNKEHHPYKLEKFQTVTFGA
jgi:hypothetical protein